MGVYLNGKLCGISLPQNGGGDINNQNKTITENGVYTADTGYTGLGTVTVDVSSIPVLQSKIARQNGLVTPDGGFQGLSSVDVGVGQIGVQYSAHNYTGAAITADSKVWLNYREPTSGSTTNIGTNSGNHYGLGHITPYGDYIYYTYSGVNCYNVTTGAITSNIFSSTYYNVAWFTDDGKLVALKGGYNYSSNPTISTIHMNGEIIESSIDYDRQLYHGVAVRPTGSSDTSYSFRKKLNGTWTTYSGSASHRPNYQATCSALVNGNPTLYYKANDSSYLYRIAFNDTDKTYSEIYVGYLSGNYSNPAFYGLGSTNDGKYIIFGSPHAITSFTSDLFIYKVNQTSGSISRFIPDTTGYNSLGAKKYAIFNNYTNVLTVWDDASPSNYVLLKYDPVNDTWTDLTISGIVRNTSLSTGPTLSADGTVGFSSNLYYSTTYFYKYLFEDSGGWNITTYRNITPNSLTGYAAEDIALGADGNVIVGRREV